MIKLDFVVNNLVVDGLHVIAKVRPEWNSSDIKYKIFGGGITNALAGFFLSDEGMADVVLVRMYGENTDIIIDREMEKNNIILLHKLGLSPPLYCTFNNGIAYGYICGQTLTLEDIADGEVGKLIAREMVKFHVDIFPFFKVEGRSNSPILFEKIRKFLKAVPSIVDVGFLAHINMEREVAMLENCVSNLEATITFTHSDLLLHNIIISQDRDRVHFIDHEYGCVTYAEYDIANHFNEFAGLDEVDYARYPSKEFQLHWLRHYVVYWRERGGEGPIKEAGESEKLLQALYARVCKFALVSHFFWGCWSFVQAEYSKINFDFGSYAKIRFDEYFRRKDEFLAVS